MKARGHIVELTTQDEKYAEALDSEHTEKRRQNNVRL